MGHAMDTTNYLPATVRVHEQDCDVTLYREPGAPWLASGEYRGQPLEAEGKSPQAALGSWTVAAWMLGEG